jgi:hypothetical protein
VTFLFEDGVSQQDRYFYLRGISEAKRYLQATLGTVVQKPFCVDARAGDNPNFPAVALAFGHRIMSYAGNTAWFSTDEATRVGVVMHEYFHVLQRELTGSDFGFVAPLWIIEGNATMVEYRALDAAGIFSMDQARSQRQLVRYESVRGLGSLELPWQELCDWNKGDCYSLAWMASEYMLNGRPVSALRSFYEEIGRGLPWALSFQEAFGWSVPEFYDAFARHRQNVAGGR